eukprot:1161917-Pelagomonas_calceolata.AAC.16
MRFWLYAPGSAQKRFACGSPQVFQIPPWGRPSPTLAHSQHPPMLWKTCTIALLVPFLTCNTPPWQESSM